MDELQSQTEDRLATTIDRVEQSFVAVMLETDAQPVLAAFGEVRGAFDAMLLAMRREERGGPNPEQRSRDVQAQHGRLTRALKELEDRGRDQLAILEQPI